MSDYNELFPDRRHEGDTELRKSQLVALRILKIVDYICEKNNIRYSLTSGTLLGAVRHKGFIPWDEDVDITMPREDFERFIEIASANLPEDLFLQTSTTDPGYCEYGTPCRIVDLNSVVEFPKKQRKEYKQKGLFIDIAPEDKYRLSFPGLYIDGFLRRIYKFSVKFYFVFGNLYKYDRRERGLRGAINFVFSNVKDPLFSELWLKSYRKFLEKRIKKNKRMRENYLVGPGLNMAWIGLFKVDDIYPLRKLEFEDTEFYGPNSFDEVLRQKYGRYMQLPKVRRSGFPEGTKVIIDIRQELRK